MELRYRTRTFDSGIKQYNTLFAHEASSDEATLTQPTRHTVLGSTGYTAVTPAPLNVAAGPHTTTGATRAEPFREDGGDGGSDGTWSAVLGVWSTSTPSSVCLLGALLVFESAVARCTSCRWRGGKLRSVRVDQSSAHVW